MDQDCIRLMWDSVSGWSSTCNEFGRVEGEQGWFFIERPCKRKISQETYKKLFDKLVSLNIFELNEDSFYSPEPPTEPHCSHAPHWEIHFKIGDQFRKYSFMDVCIYGNSEKMRSNLKRHYAVKDKLTSELFHYHYSECK